jgi:DNA-directed RNA polymerase sigma subunit (sigma70/sigma32)
VCLARASLAVAVRAAVGRLGAQQRAVIEALYLSADADGDDRRKAAVGRAEGVSRARVWQVERAALERLRGVLGGERP